MTQPTAPTPTPTPTRARRERRSKYAQLFEEGALTLDDRIVVNVDRLYKEFKGAVLPEPTQIVIAISNNFTGNWYIYFGSLAGFLRRPRTFRRRLG